MCFDEKISNADIKKRTSLDVLFLYVMYALRRVMFCDKSQSDVAQCAVMFAYGKLRFGDYSFRVVEDADPYKCVVEMQS